MDLIDGASIIVNDWAQLRNEEVLHFITDEQHQAEAEAIRQQTEQAGGYPKITLLSANQVQSGKALARFVNKLDFANVIVGATTFSIVTTNVVKKAIENGSFFISLPLSTTDGSSLLTRDFLNMNCHKAVKMAAEPIKLLNKADNIHAVTAAGTDVYFTKKHRTAFCFTGLARSKSRFASASFEICVPIEEYTGHGRVIVDGSLGYIGKVTSPFAITLQEGKITDIQPTKDGKRLKEYLESFHDPEMYRAAEFGIGLNEKAHCDGVAYIEDESAYGTFHIGFGRNLALGGHHAAAGHFDLVMHNPDITAGDKLIMKNGVLQ